MSPSFPTFVRTDGSTNTTDQYPAVRKYAGYNPAIDVRAGAHSDYGKYGDNINLDLGHTFVAE